MANENVVLCQPWEESERGWGVRPDGYSLHLNTEAKETFIKEYWDRQPSGPAPDEYSRPSGSAYAVIVTDEIYATIKEGNGIWYFGHDLKRL